ncbi:SET domain-containing protein [Ophiobolus disseminans]|uniref:SET domain-containing protein n=1 Tax=Ophiobolus disseminans TaxID=1469910 RepID=A0A6A6ZPR3_9PLEO|nr:SET domain-containing protein [Ophiobolus disseminans]
MSFQNHENTIYLTEQEVDRIRKTAKERVKKGSEARNDEREQREATPAIQQATGASLMADMGGAPDPDMTQAQGGTLPAVAIGQPYPPCAASLDKLEPMSFSDLRMETHHRGKKLVIKRASPVVGLAVRSWCMVQDEEGKETERLEFGLHKLRHGEEVLELTKHFVVKEPYFTTTDQGEATIRIDHPSDLVSLAHEIAPSELKDVAAAEKAATRCKNKGNTALKEQDLPEAYARYSEGLKIAEEYSLLSLARDIARNRAYVSLLLGQLDEVLVDAKASLIGKDDQRSKDLDSKAYFRAGSAAYALGQYLGAKKLFEEQQKLAPNDKDAKTYLKRVTVRMREQESGMQDFTKIRVGLSKARSRIDTATFIGATKVQQSPDKGRGLFATRSIAAGEPIICEKAFCVVWGHEKEAMTAMTYDLRDDRIRVSPVGLSKAIVQKLISSPSQIPRVMDLFGDYQGAEKAAPTTRDGPVVDVFRVHDIMSRNAFGPGNQFGEEGARNASTGLWVYAAYINHSCVPNALKEYIGDLMILRATRAIKAGEELFHAYDETSDYETRQASLVTTWGFECKCRLCEAQKKDSEEVRRKREELRGEADAFLAREHWANAKRLTIVKAQKIAKGIEQTYDAERYRNLPKTAGNGIQEWLARATPRR